VDHIFYFIRRSFNNMSGNLWVNVGTVLVIALSLAIPGSFLLTWYNAANFAKSWMGEVQVVAYLKDEAQPVQISTAQHQIEKDNRVERCIYVTKEEALARFKKGPKDLSDLVSSLDKNPLPASLEIRTKPGYRKPVDLAKLGQELSANSIVEDVDWGQAWSDTMDSAMKLLASLGSIAALFLMTAGAFMSSNTIRLTIARRREEIEIARLVGATNGFIVTPYIIEGLLLGLAGGLGAIGIIAAGFYIMSARLNLSATALGILIGGFQPSFHAALIVPALFGCGALLGLVGSLFSIGKHMQV